MDTHKKIREHISAFADGTLCNIDRELAMAALHTEDGRQTWQLYHRIGDVLRSEAVPELSPGFSARLAARLDDEPLPLRRNLRSAVAEGRGTPGTSGMHLLPAAGEPAATIAPGAGAALASPAPGDAADGAPGSATPAAGTPAAGMPAAGMPAAGTPDSGAGGGAMSQARPAIINVS